ncbi:WLM-domain-containing protein [Glonium stellatum]|uniref:WLM-domain-containing protein n=1 Tax=Glonium stellatum TaxID=574774 RepID=A0A8E2EMI7_9PEZI|nr:WLM-domain-containing protein [Glonium stellatum]
MPLGFERLNERTQRPNALINFIKPLPGPNSSTAHAFLSRVAAACYPFMKANHIAIMSLEEFPPNNEFVGRNFNAGEVIQLVLKTRSGNWLPMRHVQMVMVHELAHCKEMNHSKAFWKVRDAYAENLRELWQKGYTGEGVWGRGRNLLGEEIEHGTVNDESLPENLCGGTYGSRRGKRKRRNVKEKQSLSYAERKQRRILKKFGAGGKALGDDEGKRVELEGGILKKRKPRVAGSARGRELRAAAALARFEQVKKEEVKIEEEGSGSETEDDYEEMGDADAAVDVDGTKMVDGKGHDLVRICEGGDDQDGNARRELAEIYAADDNSQKRSPSRLPASLITPSHDEKLEAKTNIKRCQVPGRSSKSNHSSSSSLQPHASKVIHLDEIYKRRPEKDETTSFTPQESQNLPKPTLECPICSLINQLGALTYCNTLQSRALELAPARRDTKAPVAQTPTSPRPSFPKLHTDSQHHSLDALKSKLKLSTHLVCISISGQLPAMASRILCPSARVFSRSAVATSFLRASQRNFQTSRTLLQEAAALPAKKPVGAFRGGIFGFLLGATTAGAGMYYYVIDEYKVSNELLTEDIYALQAAVQRIEGYVRTLEEKVEAAGKKK